MKKIIPILLILSLLLCACGTQGAYVPTGDGLDDATVGGNVPDDTPTAQEVTLVYDPQAGWNPYTCADHTNRALFSLLYQSLFTVSGDYRVEPQLCSRYSVSDDGKIYIFYLEQATFSDGTPLQAQDVAASLEAARAGKIYGGRLSRVENISVTADGGVRVVLSAAYADLPLLLNIPIVPAAQVNSDRPDGTGPYRLQNTTGGLRLSLRENWWCQADLPLQAETIPLVAAQGAKAIRDEFELGDVDLVCADPSADSYVDFRSDYDLWECESGGFLYLGCRAKSTVFSNDAVRQALTYAIDRTALVNEFYHTFGRAAVLPASPASPYYSAALAAQYDYAPEKFRQVLQDEGLADSEITLLVNQEDGRRVKVAQAIAEMLEDCALVVTVKALSGSAYTTALTYGNYDLHLGQTALSPNMDLSAFFEKGGTLDYGGMNNSEIAELCRQVLATGQDYATLHRAVLDDAMLCPIAFLSYALFVRADLFTAFSPAQDCIFYYSLGKSMDEARTEA